MLPSLDCPSQQLEFDRQSFHPITALLKQHANPHGAGQRAQSKEQRPDKRYISISTTVFTSIYSTSSASRWIILVRCGEKRVVNTLKPARGRRALHEGLPICSARGEARKRLGKEGLPSAFLDLRGKVKSAAWRPPYSGVARSGDSGALHKLWQNLKSATNCSPQGKQLVWIQLNVVVCVHYCYHCLEVWMIRRIVIELDFIICSSAAVVMPVIFFSYIDGTKIVDCGLFILQKCHMSCTD